MSRLGSLYINMGEPDGELSGGCCEVDDWAAQQIESMQADMLTARSLLLRWCNDSMSIPEISQLEKETLAFVGAIK